MIPFLFIHVHPQQYNQASSGKCSLQSFMKLPQYFPEHVIIFSYFIRRIRNGEALKQAR